ncbi:hypothetical protein [Trichocoleus sp. FACHB-262]|uniref:hypothetical protein n=1 Tax=Trichocoleus sp. FACHB-262 TaxID=2692869 RepID=UPI001682C58C|nr:hypothetical protein [Trichocoleus sp. FACHB-262]MBD2120634.1 hypothetical protein [Trichocoleus sp. FACHB-262]
MSEADTPTNGPELPKPTDFNVVDPAPAEFSAEPTDLPPQRSEMLEEDWQTVDFPNAISIDAIAHPVVEVASESREPESELEESLVSLSLPEVNEIVTIMQELQQRNGYLLSRVTQLEVVLNECQITLEAQASRTQEQETILAQQSEELTAADEHIARLMHELECSHQAAQRQQILVETITAQLENSQERVAQLERECALTQQRYNEQTHAVMQAENICRDLRSRLHRQQRYTLQFKAALEKCLDVSSPCHEAHPDLTASSAIPSPTKARSTQKPAASDPAFLPKVDSIQPWSAQPWLLDADLEGEGDFAASASHLSSTTADAVSDWSGVGADLADDSLLELPSAIAPILQDLLSSPATDTLDPDDLSANHPLWDQAIADSQAQLSISYNLKKKISEATETAEQALSEQSSAEVIVTSETTESEAAKSETAKSETITSEAVAEDELIIIDDELISPTVIVEANPVEANPTIEVEALAPFDVAGWQEDLPEEPEDLVEATLLEPTAAGEEVVTPLTFGTNLPEEEELWHDLAKLIDVAEVAPAATPSATAETVEPLTDKSKAIADPGESTSTASFTFSSSWPSPTLYPLRSHKKRASMAAVELPSFPQPRP